MMRINSLLIGLVAVASTAQGFEGKELLVSGPIQQIGAGTVTVLGKDFETDTDGLAVAEVVNIYGVLQPNGSMTETVVEGTNTFGGSGDPVFIKGVVTDANPALASISVNGATVDYTEQLARSDFAPPITGDVVAISGSQPLVKGVVLASAFGDGAYAAAMTGGGFKVAAMTGGGFSASAMTGGGFSTAAMTGGGFSASAMTGGGDKARVAAMTGGGFSAAAMTGGGFSTAAMTGGGFSAAAMTGGGDKTRIAAMTGGGDAARAEAMTGGGDTARAEAMTGGGTLLRK
jgi:hypothetical protein